ncbi:clip-associated protein [Anaeramoeba flamelloides]|uniref:Clip-associated protein n=1 Tax=Anaeramoeba flamelloides TaxID=1746091 RepID=A0ABQ8YLT2_9EUKA|nr:clip-associated protein [Anaeramoeba flamelloides]
MESKKIFSLLKHKDPSRKQQGCNEFQQLLINEKKIPNQDIKTIIMCFSEILKEDDLPLSLIFSIFQIYILLINREGKAILGYSNEILFSIEIVSTRISDPDSILTFLDLTSEILDSFVQICGFVQLWDLTSKLHSYTSDKLIVLLLQWWYQKLQNLQSFPLKKMLTIFIKLLSHENEVITNLSRTILEEIYSLLGKQFLKILQQIVDKEQYLTLKKQFSNVVLVSKQNQIQYEEIKESNNQDLQKLSNFKPKAIKKRQSVSRTKRKISNVPQTPIQTNHLKSKLKTNTKTKTRTRTKPKTGTKPKLKHKTRTPNRLQTRLNLMVSNFKEESDKIEPIIIKTEKQLKTELNKILFHLTHDKGEVWKPRMEMLTKFEGLLNGGAADYSFFVGELRKFVNPITDQLKDLRSQIVKRTTCLISHLSRRLKNSFSDFFNWWLVDLLNLLDKKKQIISNSAHFCILDLIQYTKAPKILPKIKLSWLGSKSKVLQIKCSQYLIEILQKWKSSDLDRYRDSIEEMINHSMASAGQETRKNGRSAFWDYTRLFPEQSKLIYEKLNQQIQKLLKKEKPKDIEFDYSKELKETKLKKLVVKKTSRTSISNNLHKKNTKKQITKKKLRRRSNSVGKKDFKKELITKQATTTKNDLNRRKSTVTFKTKKAEPFANLPSGKIIKSQKTPKLRKRSKSFNKGTSNLKKKKTNSKQKPLLKKNQTKTQNNKNTANTKINSNNQNDQKLTDEENKKNKGNKKTQENKTTSIDNLKQKYKLLFSLNEQVQKNPIYLKPIEKYQKVLSCIFDTFDENSIENQSISLDIIEKMIISSKLRFKKHQKTFLELCFGKLFKVDSLKEKLMNTLQIIEDNYENFLLVCISLNNKLDIPNQIYLLEFIILKLNNNNKWLLKFDNIKHIFNQLINNLKNTDSKNFTLTTQIFILCNQSNAKDFFQNISLLNNERNLLLTNSLLSLIPNLEQQINDFKKNNPNITTNSKSSTKTNPKTKTKTKPNIKTKINTKTKPKKLNQNKNKIISKNTNEINKKLPKIIEEKNPNKQLKKRKSILSQKKNPNRKKILKKRTIQPSLIKKKNKKTNTINNKTKQKNSQNLKLRNNNLKKISKSKPSNAPKDKKLNIKIIKSSKKTLPIKKKITRKRKNTQLKNNQNKQHAKKTRTLKKKKPSKKKINNPTIKKIILKADQSQKLNTQKKETNDEKEKEKKNETSSSIKLDEKETKKKIEEIEDEKQINHEKENNEKIIEKDLNNNIDTIGIEIGNEKLNEDNKSFINDSNSTQPNNNGNTKKENEIMEINIKKDNTYINNKININEEKEEIKENENSQDEIKPPKETSKDEIKTLKETEQNENAKEEINKNENEENQENKQIGNLNPKKKKKEINIENENLSNEKINEKEIENNNNNEGIKEQDQKKENNIHKEINFDNINEMKEKITTKKEIEENEIEDVDEEEKQINDEKENNEKIIEKDLNNNIDTIGIEIENEKLNEDNKSFINDSNSPQLNNNENTKKENEIMEINIKKDNTYINNKININEEKEEIKENENSQDEIKTPKETEQNENAKEEINKNENEENQENKQIGNLNAKKEEKEIKKQTEVNINENKNQKMEDNQKIIKEQETEETKLTEKTTNKERIEQQNEHKKSKEEKNENHERGKIENNQKISQDKEIPEIAMNNQGIEKKENENKTQEIEDNQKTRKEQETEETKLTEKTTNKERIEQKTEHGEIKEKLNDEINGKELTENREIDGEKQIKKGDEKNIENNNVNEIEEKTENKKEQIIGNNQMNERNLKEINNINGNGNENGNGNGNENLNPNLDQQIKTKKLEKQTIEKLIKTLLNNLSVGKNFKKTLTVLEQLSNDNITEVWENYFKEIIIVLFFCLRHERKNDKREIVLNLLKTIIKNQSILFFNSSKLIIHQFIRSFKEDDDTLFLPFYSRIVKNLITALDINLVIENSIHFLNQNDVPIFQISLCFLIQIWKQHLDENFEQQLQVIIKILQNKLHLYNFKLRAYATDAIADFWLIYGNEFQKKFLDSNNFSLYQIKLFENYLQQKVKEKENRQLIN